jgi:transcriptional regulator with XRE-family HTH domain
MTLHMPPLSKRLRRARRRAGFTQENLAKAANVGIATVRRLEQGDIEEPRVSTLRKLANALGIEIHDLLEE